MELEPIRSVFVQTELLESRRRLFCINMTVESFYYESLMKGLKGMALCHGNMLPHVLLFLWSGKFFGKEYN